jgi:hypothetical protein
MSENIVIERDDSNGYMRAVLTINGIKRGEAYRSGSDEWTFTPYRKNGSRVSPVLILTKTYKTEAGALKKLRQHEADMIAAVAQMAPAKAAPAPRPDFTDPTVPLATGPGGYTLEMEAADKRRGLRNTRQLIIGAVIDADIWQTDAAEHLWAALAVIDAECVAAGLPTSLTETGALR